MEHGVRVEDQDFRPGRDDLKLGLELALRVINNWRLLGLFERFAFLDSLQENNGSRDGVIGSKNEPRLVSWPAANLLILRRNHLPWAGDGAAEHDLSLDRAAVGNFRLFIRPGARRDDSCKREQEPHGYKRVEGKYTAMGHGLPPMIKRVDLTAHNCFELLLDKDNRGGNLFPGFGYGANKSRGSVLRRFVLLRGSRFVIDMKRREV
jgi:hypothetical protein